MCPSCDSVFHLIHLHQWLENDSECPVCQREIVIPSYFFIIIQKERDVTKKMDSKLIDNKSINQSDDPVDSNERITQPTILLNYRLESIGEECTICSREFKYTDDIMQCENCKTLFHYNHIYRWLKHHTYCPFCNTIILTRLQSPLEKKIKSINKNKPTSIKSDEEMEKLRREISRDKIPPIVQLILDIFFLAFTITAICLFIVHLEPFTEDILIINILTFFFLIFPLVFLGRIIYRIVKIVEKKIVKKNHFK